MTLSERDPGAVGPHAAADDEHAEQHRHRGHVGRDRALGHHGRPDGESEDHRRSHPASVEANGQHRHEQRHGHRRCEEVVLGARRLEDPCRDGGAQHRGRHLHVAAATEQTGDLRHPGHAHQGRQELHVAVEPVATGEEVELQHVVLGQGSELDLGQVVGGEAGDRSVLLPMGHPGQVVHHRVAVGGRIHPPDEDEHPEDPEEHHAPRQFFGAQPAENAENAGRAAWRAWRAPERAGRARRAGRDPADVEHGDDEQGHEDERPHDVHDPGGEVVPDARRLGDDGHEGFEDEKGEHEGAASRQRPEAQAVAVVRDDGPQQDQDPDEEQGHQWGRGGRSSGPAEGGEPSPREPDGGGDLVHEGGRGAVAGGGVEPALLAQA